MHQYIKVIHHSENILVTFDWYPSMNELVSLDIKVYDCSKSVNHVFSFSQSHKCGRFVMFCWARDVTVVVNVCDLLQLC